MLARSAGAGVVGRLVQQLPVPTKAYYLGEGKLDELSALKTTTNYNVVIVDTELSPLQQRNLEDHLQVKVIDRVTLILDIFAKRARTREGQLQVELAQHQYLSPRLAGRWSHLERLGGGIGTRGPGESQLETDRRLINHRMHRLKSQIEEVRKRRHLYREKRQKSGIPVVALVGYTNAGKSTLLNALSQADILVEGRLFATLDPTTRRVALPDKTEVLITDTVGFIRRLPPTIITAFRATLEELSEATMLVHVVDLSSHNVIEQYRAVEGILADLDLLDKPRVTALNKIDLLAGGGQKWDEDKLMDFLVERHLPLINNAVIISADKKWGMPGLLQQIGRKLSEI